MESAERASADPIQLPVFDISNTTPDVGKSMLDAATKYGFLYVDGNSTDFAGHDVDGAFGMAQEFFILPYEQKADFKIGTDNTGWVGMHREVLDPDNQLRGDFKEAMNFQEFRDGKPSQALPPTFMQHEAELERFLSLCQKTCDRILSLLALGLEIPVDWFTSRHDASKGPTGCTLRLLYYPSLASPTTSNYDPAVDIRAGAHSDYGSVTLLFQRDGEPGLEIQTPTGEWAPVPVRPHHHHHHHHHDRGHQNDDDDDDDNDTASSSLKRFPPILVNIGDLLSYWTCGLLKSTVHRVVFPHQAQREEEEEEGGDQKEGQHRASASASDRYSMVYFCHPLHSADLVPVPSKLVEERRGQQDRAGSEGRKIRTAQEHLASRLAATFGGSLDDYMGS